jgi:hypothetical protein
LEAHLEKLGTHCVANSSFGWPSRTGAGQLIVLLSAGFLIRRCPLCDQAEENIQHILIYCVFDRQAWALILQRLGGFNPPLPLLYVLFLLNGEMTHNCPAFFERIKKRRKTQPIWDLIGNHETLLPKYKAHGVM